MNSQNTASVFDDMEEPFYKGAITLYITVAKKINPATDLVDPETTEFYSVVDKYSAAEDQYSAA